MEMLLMALCMAVFGMAVAAAAFGAATRSESPESSVQPKLPVVKAIPQPEFSDSVVSHLSVPLARVPIDVLLRQIENHVRMEQTAAESFIAFPTQARLHSKTNSLFVN